MWPSRISRGPALCDGQLRIALNSGVTEEEIVEIFIHLEASAGAAKAFGSYQVALAVFAESS